MTDRKIDPLSLLRLKIFPLINVYLDRPTYHVYEWDQSARLPTFPNSTYKRQLQK